VRQESNHNHVVGRVEWPGRYLVHEDARTGFDPKIVKGLGLI
jgi:hypothetical protein